jgi:CheY-like chemotaxis protein
MWVLVIDDVVSSAYFITEALRSLDHQVVVSHDGVEALELLDQMAFDCALVDYHMPNITGSTFLASLKAKIAEASRNVPVYVMTADNSPELVADVRRLGARAVLHKPISVRTLATALDSL